MTQVFSVTPWNARTEILLKQGHSNTPKHTLKELRERDFIRRSKWYKNLLKVYEEADTTVLTKGTNWYSEAQSFAKSLETPLVDFDKVCQVIAALSPATKWERNLTDAQQIVDYYHRRGVLGLLNNVTVCTYGPNKQKAVDILTGKQQLTINTGPKTYNFYQNIKDPSNPEYVTIDRHAFKILTRDEQGGAIRINLTTYLRASKVYQVLASDLNLLPCELQAITWLVWRNS
jgi:hypothetical protein